MRCSVVGAGAWGTALADLLARNEHEVHLWAYEPDVVESINSRHENGRFLAGHTLAETLEATGDLAAATKSSELIVLATPSHVLRRIVRGAVAGLPRSAPLVIATKGIEKETLCLMTEIVEQEVAGATVVALSGPSFAAEVVGRQPTAVVVASDASDAAELTQRAFSSPYFRAYTHTDIIGVELGGALKNVMAVATGIAEGLGLGFNARAALITRGLAEMTRLGEAAGARPETFAGLAGMGDLIVTCESRHGRNRRAGELIARGMTAEEAVTEIGQTVEGLTTAPVLRDVSHRLGVELPITEGVCAILSGQSLPDLMSRLMGRQPTEE
jgi:glycerol-3-phosphate dehydrogenase (NAD(P)+)